MIWKTKTHQFTATVCQKTGKTCPALAQTARAIVQALDTAVPATTPDFEFEGSTELSHCPQGCMARYLARKDQIRVFCGSDETDPMDALNGYAEMLFGTAFSTQSAGRLTATPCAMLEVSALPTTRPEPVLEQMAL